MKSTLSIIMTSLLLVLLSTKAFAHDNSKNKLRTYPEKSGADTEAGKVITQFHKALKLGQKNTARYQLADDVIIFEGGKVERSAYDYANNHMLADMKYLAAIKTEILEHSVKVVGDIAYSISRTKSTGQLKGKYINQDSLESMVLIKKAGRWKIKQIHWSN